MSGKGKSFWGPPIWTVIHYFGYLADLYPAKRELYLEFINSLVLLLPCIDCRKNLRTKLISHPIGSGSTFAYSYLLHDLANNQITPKRISPPFSHVQRVYSQGWVAGPAFWGPAVWVCVHSIATTLNISDSFHFERFLWIIQGLIPVGGEYLKEFLEKFPLSLYKTKHDAFYYTYCLHHFMNERLQKPTPPYLQTKTKYFSALGEHCTECGV